MIRLTDNDLYALKFCFERHFLNDDRLWIFGSRIDPLKKGGDIDLYVETYAKTIIDAKKQELGFLIEFEGRVGEQKIDIVLNILYLGYNLPIHEIAIKEGIRII